MWHFRESERETDRRHEREQSGENHMARTRGREVRLTLDGLAKELHQSIGLTLFRCLLSLLLKLVSTRKALRYTSIQASRASFTALPSLGMGTTFLSAASGKGLDQLSQKHGLSGGCSQATPLLPHISSSISLNDAPTALRLFLSHLSTHLQIVMAATEG